MYKYFINEEEGYIIFGFVNICYSVYVFYYTYVNSRRQLVD
jgi:hypothetical protein